MPDEKPKRLPGKLLTCDLCGQQPESLAFDPDECRDNCPFSVPLAGNLRIAGAASARSPGNSCRGKPI